MSNVTPMQDVYTPLSIQCERACETVSHRNRRGISICFVIYLIKRWLFSKCFSHCMVNPFVHGPRLSHKQEDQPLILDQRRGLQVLRTARDDFVVERSYLLIFCSTYRALYSTAQLSLRKDTIHTDPTQSRMTRSAGRAMHYRRT